MMKEQKTSRTKSRWFQFGKMRRRNDNVLSIRTYICFIRTFFQIEIDATCFWCLLLLHHSHSYEIYRIPSKHGQVSNMWSVWILFCLYHNMCRECRLKHDTIYEFVSRLCECVCVSTCDWMHMCECLENTKRIERWKRNITHKILCLQL